MPALVRRQCRQRRRRTCRAREKAVVRAPQAHRLTALPGIRQAAAEPAQACLVAPARHLPRPAAQRLTALPAGVEVPHGVHMRAGNGAIPQRLHRPHGRHRTPGEVVMKTNTTIVRGAPRRTLLSTCLGAALAVGSATVEASSPAVLDATWQGGQSALFPTAGAHAESPLATEWKRLHPPPPPGPDGGVTRTVTNCNASGAGSLGAAVHASVGADTVAMTALACSTITLTTGALATGATDLAFIGPGRDQLSIDGDMVNPVFAHVGSGELYINGFTVVNGGKYAIGGNDAPGGCIYSQGHVTLVDAGAKYCVAQ